MNDQALIISREDGVHGCGNLSSPLHFGFEHELLGVDAYDDNTSAGVERHVGSGVVVDVLGRGVHPRAE